MEIYLGDSLYNAGILGFYRILEYAKEEHLVQLEGQKLIIDEQVFTDFSMKYFAYLSNHFSYESNYHRVINYKDTLNYYLKNVEQINLESLGKMIDDVKKTVQSNSYKNVYPLIENLSFNFEQQSKNIKKITLKKNQTVLDIKDTILSTVNELLTIISHLELSKVKYQVLPRVLSYRIIQPFWTNVSFLNSTASKKDMYEEYEKYFIRPIVKYLEKIQQSPKKVERKFACACCNNKMQTIGECFDLTWLNRIGVDAARKTSHYWNHQRDIFICPICNLIYSCIPFGYNFSRSTGIFINMNQSIRTLLSINSLPIQDSNGERITRNELEQEAYYKIFQLYNQEVMNLADREIDNIQVIKFDVANESRPYTFNLISKQKLEYIRDNQKEIQYLIDKNFKENGEYYSIYQIVVSAIYNGISLNYLLFRLFKLIILKEYRNLHVLQCLIKLNNNVFKGGHKFMTPEELKKVRIHGFRLRSKYYGSEKKLDAISYRLLNALKVKNPNKFMETFLQAHSYVGETIPSIFIQLLEDKDKFQTIGYAFLLGLNGYGETKKTSEEEKNNEK